MYGIAVAKSDLLLRDLAYNIRKNRHAPNEQGDSEVIILVRYRFQ